MNGDVTTFVNGTELTARFYSGDRRVHWYRTSTLSGALSDPHWAFAWCRDRVSYDVRHPKDELSTILIAPVCSACSDASPFRLTERVAVRQHNERPWPDERCVCDDSPAWVIVVEYSDHTTARIPYCGQTPTSGKTSAP